MQSSSNAEAKVYFQFLLLIILCVLVKSRAYEVLYLFAFIWWE